MLIILICIGKAKLSLVLNRRLFLILKMPTLRAAKLFELLWNWWTDLYALTLLVPLSLATNLLATHISHLKDSIDGGRVSLGVATGDRILDC